jgi:hypothetical protein
MGRTPRWGEQDGQKTISLPPFEGWQSGREARKECKGLAQIRRKAVYPKQTKNSPPNPTPGKNKRTSTLVEAGKENTKREVGCEW